jgi:precorrin-2 dehydrogenase/sirohydrochlorin ferrochelatase
VSTSPIAFPAFLDLRRRLVVVVGTGTAAEKKAHSLLKYGADLVVIGPDPTAALIDAEAQGTLTLERRPFAEGDLDGAFVTICVEPDDKVRHAVISEATSRGCLVSVAGDSASSNFSTPSTVRRGLLQVAISTAGQAPEAARQARSLIQDELGHEWTEYVALLSRLRASLTPERSAEERQRILEAVVASDVLDRIRRGEIPDADAVIEEFGVVHGDPAEAGEEAQA